jgi:hypothetical protein
MVVKKTRHAAPLHALSASWWLSLWLGVAPHFRQAPWNGLLRNLLISPRNARQKQTQSSVPQLTGFSIFSGTDSIGLIPLPAMHDDLK